MKATSKSGNNRDTPLSRARDKIKFHKVFNYWPYIILLVPTLTIMLPLAEPGAFLHQDFPFIIHALSPLNALYTWTDLGSNNNFENLPRIPETGIGLALLTIGIPSEWISKLMVVFVFYLASVSFYVFSMGLLRNKVKLELQLEIAAIVGSLFYAYNTWSFDRILHWHLWLGYSLLPLFFISVIFAFKNPRRLRYYLVAIVSWSVASSSPHMLVFFGLVFIGISSFFIIRKIHDRGSLIQPAKTAIIISTFFILANAYWIYPAILTIESNELDLTSTFGFVATEETTKLYSANSNFTNVFRFVQSENAAGSPANSTFYLIWSSVGYLLPAIAFSALLSRKYFKYSIVFSSLAILGIYLVMGSNEPVDLYSILLFELPYFSDIAQNLFRDPNRWSFLIGISYSMLLSIGTFEVFRITRKIGHKTIVRGLFAFIIVGSIAIQSYPIYRYYFVDKYRPVIIPDDLGKLNKYLSSIHTDKVVYFPMLLYSDDVFHYVDWDNRTLFISDLYQWSSPKPSMGHYRDLHAQNYYRYLTSLITANRTESISNMVTLFGTSYIIFHNDTLMPGTLDIPANGQLIKKLSSLPDIRNITNIGFFNIFKTNGINTSINIPKYNIVATGGLGTLTSLNHLDSFNSSQTSVIFLDQSTKNEIGSIENITNVIDSLILKRNASNLFLSSIDDRYVIAPLDATNHHNVSDLWSKAGTLDPWRGEFHPYISDLRIENWDFDYGKGLVMTQGRGATLDIPFSVEKAGDYDIFLRYMKNQRGGELDVYLDNKLIGTINTRDEISNSFVWENVISNIDLTEGEHTLTLENVLGFNAVNIFTVLPTDETSRLVEEAHTIANNTKNIYLLEAESDFYGLGTQLTNQTTQQGFSFDEFLKSLSPESAGPSNIINLRPGSEIYTDLDIIKDSNYTLALRADNCGSCAPLKVSIEDIDNDITIVNNATTSSENTGTNKNNNNSQLAWLYLDDIYLEPGHYKVKIYSGSQRDLDLVVLYSSVSNKFESLDEIFEKTNAPAHITEYRKLDPTKYTVDVTNATRPYLLSFFESYDPFWRAYVQSNETDIEGIVDNTNSYSPAIPLYSLINGFYIDKLGDYMITIEYEPQNWLIQGGIISIATIIVFAAIMIFDRYHRLSKGGMKFISNINKE